jgi:hypothetical protein
MVTIIDYSKQILILEFIVNIIERRHFERLSILGAKVLYKRNNGHVALVPINDLTLRSMCFKIKHPLKLGEHIELDIIIPDKAAINVKGIVTRLEIPAYAVAQFYAFGTDERYNSMDSYDQLKKIMDEYLVAVN